MPRGEMEAFGVSALFDEGGALVEGPLPLLICRPCIGKMTASLSKSSRDVWQKFLADHFERPSSDGGFPGLV